MSEFLTAILAFPTVLFTVPLGVVLVYWLLVLLGALDLEILDFGEVADAADAGSADGLGTDGDAGDTGDTGVLDVLGLRGVPTTFALSILIFLAWLLCLAASQTLDIEGGLLGAGTALLSLGLAVPCAALAVRPLRRLFHTDRAIENRSLVGKVCTVATLRVDERYGQAEIADGGAGLLVQVRSTQPDNGLRRGDQAIVYEYRDEVFWVSPLDRAMAEGTARPEDWRQVPPDRPLPAAEPPRRPLPADEPEAPPAGRGREKA